MIGLMVVKLMVFHTCGKLVLWEDVPILRNEYAILGQNYVALFHGRCCVAMPQGSPSVSKFSLREFGI